MHSNGTLLLDVPLDAPLDTRCVYTLRLFIQRSLDSGPLEVPFIAFVKLCIPTLY